MEYGREQRRGRWLVCAVLVPEWSSGCEVNPDDDVPDENNKAEADPPTVTENPLQSLRVDVIVLTMCGCVVHCLVVRYCHHMCSWQYSNGEVKCTCFQCKNG
ncbi:hypothetical protein T4D_12547 [Trichinella pseudospiralis]|uniref:Uncharacterized protein n=1 Tax=Trichinella pseudospiralis TaxID=6337 RepID=A0A0V1FNZ4_TRIPS|nr:hypothetical protein T4D_12547 [Trichinella pseudospiralis]